MKNMMKNKMKKGDSMNRGEYRARMAEESKFVGLTQRKPTDINLVEIRVGKISQSAMLDTGAQISCMSYDVYKKSGLSEQFELQSSDLEYVLGVSGTPVKVMGTAEVPLTICKLELIQKFYIFEKFRQPIILGVDFLVKQKAKVNFENYTLEIQGGMTVAKMFSNPQKLSLARSVNRISIPSKTAVVTKVKVKNSDSQNLSLVEPVTTLATKHCIMGARSLSKVNNGYVLVKLLNPTAVDIEINQNEPIARIHPCHDHDLCNETEEESILNTGIHTVGVQSCDSDKEQQILSDKEYTEIAESMGVDLSQSDLSDTQKHELLVLLGKNSDVFATSIGELGSTNLHYHHIETGNAKPVRRPPYRTTPEKHAEISRQVEEMEKHGIISKSTSQWSSPVLLVRKKSGEYRFAVDFRALNSVTEPMHFPVTHFQEAVDSIGQANAAVFSVLDMHSGFWQIPLHPDTKHKTGFVTHEGNYVFNKLAFGLMNSPNAFAMVMSEVLRGINWRFAQVYVDDILVYSADFDQHLRHLQEIFDRFRKANLKLKPSKCCFAARSVRYLGHKFSSDGIFVDEEKIASVVSYPQPKSQREVRAFLGLCNYYRKFVKGYAGIASPLNRLLSKDVKFEWTTECEDAFIQLKKALTESPILSFPNFSERFYLYVDASNQAISYILGQKDDKNREHVIAYGGRSLNKSERNWGITDLEGLALVEGIRHFKVYLSDKPFTVYSDHQALKSLKTSKATGRLGRWAVFLQGYQYEVIHKPGKIHSNADSLSRREYSEHNQTENEDADDLSLGPEVCVVGQHPVNEMREYKLHYETVETVNVNILSCQEPADSLSTMIHAIEAYEQLDPLRHVSEVCPISSADLKNEQREDPDFKSIIDYLVEKQVPDNRNEANRIVAEAQYYIIEDGILFHLYQPRSKGHKWTDVKKQLAIPRKLRDNVLKSYHVALFGGHQGQERTYEAIRMKYFWPKMYSDIQTYVKTCIPCQQAKRYIHQKQALLKPLPIGHVFSRLHIDILGPLPKTKDGYRYILMVVDSFSKWTEAFPLQTMEAREVAWKLYDEIICRFGCPDSFLTDRAQNFMSNLLKELCSILGITKLATSSYHAACNSQVERINSVVLQKLRIYGNEKQSDWAQLLPSIMFSYRTTPALDSTNYSPHFILFGRECRMPLDTELIPSMQLNKTTEQHLNRIIENQKMIRELVSENIAKAQAKYKAQYDKNAADPKFNIFSNVWLYNPRTPQGLSPKIINRWVGPYYVSEKLSECSFRLRDLKTHKAIKSTVHANRLRPYFDPSSRPTNPPPNLQEPIELYDTDEVDDNENQPQADQTDAIQGDNTDDDQVQDQADTTVALQDTLTPEKILRAYPNFRGEGRMLYKVRFRDTSTDKTQTTYTYDTKLPENMRKEFHIKYTYSGKARKRSQHKPVTTQ